MPKVPSRLKELYLSEIRPQLLEKFNHKNNLAVPRITKVVVNMGVGRAREQPKLLDTVSNHLAQLTGQRPVITEARRSIAGFKLREGMKIGCKVTLRKDRMWHFLDKLIALAVPRIRDFRGLPVKSFDGRGNYTLGLSEQGLFPEIDVDKLDAADQQGMNVTINISGGSNEQSRALLEQMGMPFVRPEEAARG